MNFLCVQYVMYIYQSVQKIVNIIQRRRLNLLTNYNPVITFHCKEKPLQFIDSLVLKGYYMSRSEFVRKAIDQKIDKVIERLSNPFYLEHTNISKEED